ncbi:hypothetical protein PAMC26510_37855 [Caballeronia sordidicola]|uniref:Uncharacterized protein n=1 Tax=Caballeronia sordidicola TaxID=196367 RepID=A0A242MBH8_CABSO|nr:hypothetical protein PAMC26510_37855 [Caballeronia sordidicola]OTP68093.1 hypothetical protein PAMC26577_34745 [Caballeronia sordidicola]
MSTFAYALSCDHAFHKNIIMLSIFIASNGFCTRVVVGSR